MTTTRLEKTRFDPLQPVVAEIVTEILSSGDVVAPIDVLVRLEIIEAAQVEAWRRGGLPYLERAIQAGLSRVGRLLRLVGEHCLALGLAPVLGKYQRRGKGRLRFSKRGDQASEAAYATHFVRPQAADSGPK